MLFMPSLSGFERLFVDITQLDGSAYCIFDKFSDTAHVSDNCSAQSLIL